MKHKANAPIGTRSTRAFTFIELVIIVCTLVLLACVLAPAFAHSRSGDRAFVCLNHHRMLAMAWKMYAADNGDRLANNFGIPGTEQTIVAGSLVNWANNVMTWGTGNSVDDRSNTNVSWITKGVMGAYTLDLAVYRCPSDNFVNSAQASLGWTARLRSISMSFLLGRYNDAADPSRNAMLPQYGQYLKLSQIPKPFKTWAFLDEHPDSINDGYFIASPQNSSWGDIPAAFHNGGCTFSFADNHVELRKWKSASSKLPVQFSYPVPPSFDPLGRVDFNWYLSHQGFVDFNSGALLFGY